MIYSFIHLFIHRIQADSNVSNSKTILIYTFLLIIYTGAYIFHLLFQMQERTLEVTLWDGCSKADRFLGEVLLDLSAANTSNTSVTYPLGEHDENLGALPGPSPRSRRAIVPLAALANRQSWCSMPLIPATPAYDKMKALLNHRNTPGNLTKALLNHRKIPCNITKALFNHRNTPGNITKALLNHRNTPGNLAKALLNHRTTPCNKTKALLNHWNTPCNITEALLNHRNTPCNITKALLNHRNTPCNITKALLNHRNTPCNITKALLNHRNTPCNITKALRNHRNTPSNPVTLRALMSTAVG